MKKIINIFLIIICLLTIFTNNVLAETKKETFYIVDMDDWKELAKNCELDSYSSNLTVELMVNLDFKNDIVVIPYFNGTFNGNNHELNNIYTDSSQINDGLFRITGKRSSIKDLTVSLNADHNNNRFGFIGYNQGEINNIKINGCLHVLNEAGFIAGYNSVNGKINGCSVSGSIDGKEYIGGVCGKNYGIISNCWNYSKVNTEVREDNFDISSLTIEDIANGEKTSIITDFGGICGTSFGTITDCRNTGVIGHEHIGYNVGGIAGSQSGYIANCYNSGYVLGRKEIGGIVGQLEPAMALVYREDYLQMMSNQLHSIGDETKSLANDLRNTKDTNTKYLDTIVDDANEMYDAIEIMIDHRDDLDHTEFDNAKTVLSSSTRDIIDTADKMVNYYSDTNDAYNRIKKISDDFVDFGDTCIDFTDSLTNEKEMYKDISNNDNSSSKQGKIFDCVNRNVIEGDINVGGIVGSIALENDMDPEDDFDIVGQKSFDVTYEIKAIIDKCINYSQIKIKRNNAGGICGYESVGAIKNSINYGMLDCEECDYIGGIVGKASSYLTKNYSKCFIKGNNYVGGIAGSSLKGDSNGSFSQILEFNSSGGSVFGNYQNIDNEIVEKAKDIKNNWYVYDDLAAIDGISYDKKAYKVSFDDVLKMKLDESLTKVNVIFMDDDKVIYNKVLNYDESMDEKDVPDDIIKNDEYRIWDNYDSKLLKNIKKDLLFTCTYNDVYPSISSNEKPLPYVVAIGEFSIKDSLNANVINDIPVHLSSNNCVTYEIESNIANSSSIYGYRFYANEYKKYNVYAKNEDGTWGRIDYTVDGRYVAIDNNNVKVISIVEVKDYTIYYVVGISVLVIIIGMSIFVKKKKKALK